MSNSGRKFGDYSTFVGPFAGNEICLFKTANGTQGITLDVLAIYFTAFFEQGGEGFTLSYNLLADKPTLGTSAGRNVPATGDASATQVVLGNDSRLSNARAPTAHSHNVNELSNSTVLGRSLLTAGTAAAIRSLIEAGTSNFSGNYADLIGAPVLFSGSYNDLTGKPTLGSAAGLNAPASGNAATDQVVLGSDTRLNNSRAPTAHEHSIDDLIDATLLGKLLLLAPSEADVRLLLGLGPSNFSGNYADLIGAPELFSGSYNDLTDKPELFSGSYNDLTDKPELFSGNYADLSGTPSLFSGNYADLVGLPDLGSVALLDEEEIVLADDSRLADAREPLEHSHTVTQISNATEFGRSILTAADAAAVKTLLAISEPGTTPSRVFEGALSAPDSCTTGYYRLYGLAGTSATNLAIKLARRPDLDNSQITVVEIYKVNPTTGTRTLLASPQLAATAWNAASTATVSVASTDYLAVDVIQGSGGGLNIHLTLT